MLRAMFEACRKASTVDGSQGLLGSFGVEVVVRAEEVCITSYASPLSS